MTGWMETWHALMTALSYTISFHVDEMREEKEGLDSFFFNVLMTIRPA